MTTVAIVVIAGAALGLGMVIGYNIKKWEEGKAKKQGE